VYAIRLVTIVRLCVLCEIAFLYLYPMVKFFFTLLICLSVAARAQEGNPFSGLKYDSIVIYDFNTKMTGRPELSIVQEDGSLAVSIAKSKRVTTKEAKALSERVGLKSSYGKGEAACFDPHLGIVYYRNGKPLEYISVCMDCNRLEASIKIPNQEQGRQQTEEGDVYYTGMGMSKSLKRFFDNLLIKYKFSHTVNWKGSFGGE
jgi:hypothetical protein